MRDVEDGDDNRMMDEEIEENELEAPAYIDPDDHVIEVQVDDDNEPMEEEEEEYEEEEAHDGGAIAAEDDDTAVDGRQLPDQKEMSNVQISFHSGPIYAVEIVNATEDRIILLSGGGDDQAMMHVGAATSTTTITNVSSQTLYTAKDSVVALAVSAEFVAIGSYDGRIIVLPIASLLSSSSSSLSDHPEGESTVAPPRIELDGPSDVEWLHFHPTGSVLLAGSTDGTVWMYSVRPPAQCMQVFVGHEGAVTAGAFVFKVAATCSADGTVRIWAPKTGTAKHVFRCTTKNSNSETTMGLTCLAVGGGVDGKLVLAGGEDGMAYCCHIASQKIIHRFEHTPYIAVPTSQTDNDSDVEEETPPISVEAVGFAPLDASNTALWCATGGVDGVLKIWDLTSGQCRHVCQVVVGDDTAVNNAGGITRLQWLEQHYVVTCGTTGIVRIWDARSGTLVQTFTAHGSAVMNDMAISINATEIQIVTGSDDHMVRVFSLSKSVLTQTL